MENQSYWLGTAPTFTAGITDAVSGDYDVAVIGGGFTGLSAARTLAKQGVKVALLEANQIIGEASGQNGGQCSTGIAQDFASMAGTIGLERTCHYYQTYSNAVDTLRRIVTEEDIDCDFRESGKLKLAAKPKHAEKLHRTYELVKQEVDPNVSFLDAQQLRSEVYSDQFYAGFIQHNSVQMHVGKFGVGLAHCAARYGADIYEHAAVTQCKSQANGYQIQTPRGQLHAKQILLATGISRHGPLAWYRRRIVPIGSFIIVTDPMDPKILKQLMPYRRSYVTSRIIGNYFRVIDDNRLLFGGRARFAMSNPQSDAMSGQVLMKAMGQMFPQLANIKAAYCWGGLVDITADRLPRAGEHAGMHYAMGYSGHGVQMSIHMGEVMADVMGGNPQANPWKDMKWPAIPGHLGKPWFLPLVGAYFKLQDHLH